MRVAHIAMHRGVNVTREGEDEGCTLSGLYTVARRRGEVGGERVGFDIRADRSTSGDGVDDGKVIRKTFDFA